LLHRSITSEVLTGVLRVVEYPAIDMASLHVIALPLPRMGSAQQFGHLITHQADLFSFLRWCTGHHDAANTTDQRTPRMTSFERGATTHPQLFFPTTGQRAKPITAGIDGKADP